MARLKVGLLSDRQARFFELGGVYGNIAGQLANQGWNVTGVDPLMEGIARAMACYPDLRLEEGQSYDGLAGKISYFSRSDLSGGR